MIENNVIINFASHKNVRELSELLDDVLKALGLSLLNREVVKLRTQLTSNEYQLIINTILTEEKGRNLGGSNFSKTDPLHKDYWATPQEMVDGLLRYAVVKGIVPEGLPLLDVCASEQNKKCERFITEQQDTLATPWGENNLCWLNPPYSNVQPFLNKAVAEAANGNYTVALLKNDCSTKWFHYAAKNAIAVVYIMLGRIGFVSAMTGESVGGNNFSSVAFIFGPGRKGLRSLYVTKQKLGELARG